MPNKFPALQVEGGLDREGEGMFDRMNGIGAHEVIIETPHHDQTLASMSEGEIERVLQAFRARVLDLKRDRRFRYILIFKNHGAPPAPPSSTPILADCFADRAGLGSRRDRRAQRHCAGKERCVFCDIVRQELATGRRIILENADIVALAPFAPRFPFETWLVPKRHGARFEDAAGHEYEALARLLKAVLRRMNRALETPSYNLIIHTAPFSEEAGDFYHWHVELIPKLTKVAGFEWGSGFYINPTSPEEAARVLRDARI